jgi:hypothetical protein
MKNPIYPMNIKKWVFVGKRFLRSLTDTLKICKTMVKEVPCSDQVYTVDIFSAGKKCERGKMSSRYALCADFYGRGYFARFRTTSRR